MIRQLAHLSESYARKLGHALQGLPPPEATSKVIRRLESELEVVCGRWRRVVDKDFVIIHTWIARALHFRAHGAESKLHAHA